MNEHIEVTVHYFKGGHDGPGWYYWETEYPDEGSTGAFPTPETAEAHALDNYQGGESVTFSRSGKAA